MRTSALLLALLVAFAAAEAIKIEDLSVEGTGEGEEIEDKVGSMNDADAFVKEVQGPEDNLYIVFFKKEETEMSKDVHAELDKAAEDPRLKDFDIFQEEWKGKWSIKVGELDVRDQTKWKAATDLVGANDADFKMTYPFAMITRKGKGYLASLKEFVATKGEDKSISQAFIDKIIEVAGAKKVA